jgi:hypothetical protein
MGFADAEERQVSEIRDYLKGGATQMLGGGFLPQVSKVDNIIKGDDREAQKKSFAVLPTVTMTTKILPRSEKLFVTWRSRS